MNTTSNALRPTLRTRALQIATAWFAAFMIIGTLLVGFIFETKEALTGAFERTGLNAAEAADAAGKFVIGYRAVALLFCAFYALGAYYALKRKTWAFWFVIIVFGLLGGIGTVMVPLRDTGLSTLGLVVSTLTDGSGFVIGAILFWSYLKYRTPWAQRRA